MFEEKYNRKLKYRLDVLAYISYEETEVNPDAYDG
jgi:hypothetical protein